MGRVYTLTGSVDASELGPTLPHEHLPLHYVAWDRDDFEPGSKYIVREWMQDVLDDLCATPFRTLVDVSPIGHGRDVPFRRELLGKRPLNVIMCTGAYLDGHQPEWMKEKSAGELADLFTKEIETGIGDTGVRAGIIKIAPDVKSGQSRKVCRAAVEASRRTGAAITTHTCSANRKVFEMLVELGADPKKIYIGHADFAEVDENAFICQQGGHVLFTVWDIAYMIPERRNYARFAELVRRGYLHNVLMSVDFAIMVHNAASPTFLSWTLYGVERRTYSYMFRAVMPRLKHDFGLTDEELKVITEQNPREMLDFRA
jgi:phosphotriesterase-related protein